MQKHLMSHRTLQLLNGVIFILKNDCTCTHILNETKEKLTFLGSDTTSTTIPSQTSKKNVF